MLMRNVTFPRCWNVYKLFGRSKIFSPIMVKTLLPGLRSPTNLAWARSSMPHYLSSALLRHNNPEEYERATKLIQLRPDINEILARKKIYEQGESKADGVKISAFTQEPFKLTETTGTEDFVAVDELTGEVECLITESKGNEQPNCALADDVEEQGSDSSIVAVSNNEIGQLEDSNNQSTLISVGEMGNKQEVNLEEVENEVSFSTSLGTLSDYLTPEQNTLQESNESRTSISGKECYYEEVEQQVIPKDVAYVKLSDYLTPKQNTLQESNESRQSICGKECEYEKADQQVIPKDEENLTYRLGKITSDFHETHIQCQNITEGKNINNLERNFSVNSKMSDTSEEATFLNPQKETFMEALEVKGTTDAEFFGSIQELRTETTDTNNYIENNGREVDNMALETGMKLSEHEYDSVEKEDTQISAFGKEQELDIEINMEETQSTLGKEPNLDEILNIPDFLHPSDASSIITTFDDLSYSERDDSLTNFQWLSEDDMWDEYPWQPEESRLKQMGNFNAMGKSGNSSEGNDENRSQNLKQHTHCTDQENIYGITQENQSEVTTINANDYSMEIMDNSEKSVGKSVRQLFPRKNLFETELTNKDKSILDLKEIPLDVTNVIGRIKQNSAKDKNLFQASFNDKKTVATQTPEKNGGGDAQIMEMGVTKTSRLNATPTESIEEEIKQIELDVETKIERTRTWLSYTMERTSEEKCDDQTQNTIPRSDAEPKAAEDNTNNPNQSNELVMGTTNSKKVHPTNPTIKLKHTKKEQKSFEQEGIEHLEKNEKLLTSQKFQVQRTPTRKNESKQLTARRGDRSEKASKRGSQTVRLESYTPKRGDPKKLISASLTCNEGILEKPKNTNIEPMPKSGCKSEREEKLTGAKQKLTKDIMKSVHTQGEGLIKAKNYEVKEQMHENKPEPSDVTTKLSQSSLKENPMSLTMKENKNNSKVKEGSPIVKTIETSRVQKLKLEKEEEKIEIPDQSRSIPQSPSLTDHKKSKPAKSTSKRWNY